MGAVIRGAGTDSIRIEGVDMLKAQIPHTIIPDRIEAGTYVSLAACIGNGIRIHNIIEEHLDSYLAKVKVNFAVRLFSFIKNSLIVLQ